MAEQGRQIVGVLSDTHGDVPGWVLRLFREQQVCTIIHAGDIVSGQVISELQNIAPVTWVRGNMDGTHAGERTSVAQSCGLLAYVLHSLDQLDLDPLAAGIQAVISGHTHVPKIEWRQGVLYLNPGSPSHPRYGNPPSVALIEVEKGVVTPRIWFKDQATVRPATGAQKAL